ncbi:MAG: hypothetical protein Q9203_002782 [Teloschistes exilis]
MNSDIDFSEIDRQFERIQARARANQLKRAQDAGFTNVEDHHKWLIKEENESHRRYEVKIAEEIRAGNIPVWVQKERDRQLREAQEWHFDPEKYSISGFFCPGNLETEANSTTGPSGEFDARQRRQLWNATLNMQGPSRRLKDFDLYRYWSFKSPDEHRQQELPIWAMNDPMIRYLMEKADRPPSSPHDHTVGGDYEDQDQDVQTMETADGNLADMEPLGGQSENRQRRRKRGKGEIKSSKNRSAAAQQSQRAPAMKQGRPKKVISDSVSQWLCSSLGERKQTRSQKRKTFVALNANSQPEVIEPQPKRSQRTRRAV